jgi:hypothetical protein
MVAVLPERQHLLEQQLERALRIARLLGRRAAERRAQRRGVTGADRRQIGERFEVIDDPVDDQVPKAPHLVRRQRKRFRHGPLVTRYRLVGR